MGKVTIDQLAGMMKTSFEHLEKETKGRFEQLEDKMDQGFTGVNTRLDNVETRLDHIEGLVEGGQERRISRLEDDVRVIKTTLGK